MRGIDHGCGTEGGRSCWMGAGGGFLQMVPGGLYAGKHRAIDSEVLGRVRSLLETGDMVFESINTKSKAINQ